MSVLDSGVFVALEALSQIGSIFHLVFWHGGLPIQPILEEDGHGDSNEALPAEQ